MKTSSARVLAAACSIVVGALLLAGCSSAAQHQVVGAGEECSSCHSEEKAVYERGADVPSGAVESGIRVAVSSDADAVSVCVPRFTAEDGSRYVPVEASRMALDAGSATLELEEGLWAICVDDGDSARAQLVRVDPSRSDSAEIKL
ncbi:hypothetical protein [Arabiibacter massiliensis]|uniref:hypothetical protein n=1 Tax=Arabiibacter massiliensis TaxID=1870985 RepID=UPI0009BBD56A|nr:hypothetical protein [Arabiibacter massiliensis]